MKSKDEFIASWSDELNGLLIGALAEGLKPNEFAVNGRFMIQQMRRARDLLARMHSDLAGMPSPQQPTLPAKNGQPATKPEAAKRT